MGFPFYFPVTSERVQRFPSPRKACDQSLADYKSTRAEKGPRPSISLVADVCTQRPKPQIHCASLTINKPTKENTLFEFQMSSRMINRYQIWGKISAGTFKFFCDGEVSTTGNKSERLGGVQTDPAKPHILPLSV